MNRPVLGLRRNEVKLVDHDPRWKAEFEQVRKQIIQIMPELHAAQVEHIGSTAIVDIQAKPVLDIAIGVKQPPEHWIRYDQPLRAIGFYRLNVQREQEVVFARFTDLTYEVKTHFIHMISYEQEHWKNMLFFRDYLNTHAELRLEYEQLKQAFTTEHGGIQEYTQYKEQWIQQIFAQRQAD